MRSFTGQQLFVKQRTPSLNMVTGGINTLVLPEKTSFARKSVLMSSKRHEFDARSKPEYMQ
jgi:hypothetical protein